MLSDEEEKARALKVSKLYLTPLKRKTDATSWIEKFSWSVTIQAAIFMAVPIILANTLYDFYFLSTYTNLTDIQAASMLFIVMLILIGGLLILCFRASFNTIYNRYATGRTIFLLSLIAGISFIPFIRTLTTGAAGQELPELVIRSSLFAAACLVLSIIIFAVITKVVLVVTTRKSL